MPNPKHKLIYKYDGSINLYTTAIDVTGLQGDTYDYQIDIVISNVAGTYHNYAFLRFNNDSTTNYRNYSMFGVASTVVAGVSDSQDYMATNLGVGNIANSSGSGRLYISGSSGEERHLHSLNSQGTSDKIITIHDNYWKNTADELTSIQIYNDVASGAGATNVNVKVYQVPKKANLENYELIEEITRTASSSQIVFSNLDGDTDKEYYVEIESDTDASNHITLNNYSTANQINQSMYNRQTSIAAASLSNATNLGIMSMNGSATIYAESGRYRLVNCSRISQPYNTNDVQSQYISWFPDTSTNITSIEVSATVAQTATAKLYRRRLANYTIDPVPMRTIAEIPVNGDFSDGVTLGGLSGDDIDVIKVEFIGVGNTASYSNLSLQINGYTGTVVQQSLQGVGATVFSITNDTPSMFTLLQIGGSNNCPSYEKIYLYPQTTGAARPLLQSDGSDGIIDFKSSWFPDIVNEITTLKVCTSDTNSITGTIKVSIPKTNKTNCTITIN